MHVETWYIYTRGVSTCMWKPGIFIHTIQKPGAIIHLTLNIIMLMQYVHFVNACKQWVDATNKYFIYAIGLDKYTTKTH